MLSSLDNTTHTRKPSQLKQYRHFSSRHLFFFCSLFAGMHATVEAAPAIDTTAIQVAPSTIIYRARLGDTLSVIAANLTTKSSNWVALQKINHIPNERAIPIGTAITIPVALLAQDPANAKIIALSGTVNAMAADGSAIALAAGTLLSEGARIETGKNSFLTLALIDETRVVLPSNSQVKLTQLRSARYTKTPLTEIMLMQGRVDSSVTPLKENKGRFEVRSPLAVAGVRGTHFLVEVRNNTMATDVWKGGVAITQNAHPTALTLQGGQGNVTQSQGVGKAVQLLPMPEIAGNPVLQERPIVRFNVVPLPGATSYRTWVVGDQVADHILTEIETTSTDIKIDGLTDGSYSAYIAPLDNHGLQGFPHVIPFTLKARPEPPFAITPKGKDRSADPIFSWAETLDAKSYRFQIATDAMFSHPIVDEPALASPQYKPGKLPLGQYYWRVATTVERDGKPDHGPFGDVQTFALLPQLQLPEINPTGNTLAFRWQADADANQTFVTEIARDAAFTSLFLTQPTTTPEISIPNPPNGIYFVRVQATDADGYVSPFSAAQKIIIGSRWTTSDGALLLNTGGITPASY
ncbi:FecR domain-containing protein [Glaciimonas sp. PCH181]|uniref:FecR domain-containing protein n=1 Tax=Glaciimonas sp. PCH181 TaxID=2133943 RepID=UPI000D3B05C2|nr:FecR domain-containing protein [Glaciimonas sp. PCH181]PUA16360.1 hypothetical protein C7W93_23895 [Glaciimonas sp. PCH181]